jgi:hypothetical protein
MGRDAEIDEHNREVHVVADTAAYLLGKTNRPRKEE